MTPTISIKPGMPEPTPPRVIGEHRYECTSCGQAKAKRYMRMVKHPTEKFSWVFVCEEVCDA